MSNYHSVCSRVRKFLNWPSCKNSCRSLPHSTVQVNNHDKWHICLFPVVPIYIFIYIYLLCFSDQVTLSNLLYLACFIFIHPSIENVGSIKFIYIYILFKENKATESFELSSFKLGVTHVLFSISTYGGIVNCPGNCQ